MIINSKKTHVITSHLLFYEKHKFTSHIDNYLKQKNVT